MSNVNNIINLSLKCTRYSNNRDTVCVEIENNRVIKQENHGSCLGTSKENNGNTNVMPDSKRVKYDPSIALNPNQNFF